ncbi:protein-disulfide reductase DsbD family protein [Phycisphaeraceae bacterium D3-23]
MTRAPLFAHLLALAVALLVTVQAGAQFQQDPVTWSALLSQDQARPGDEVIVAVKADVTDQPDAQGKRWHFYPRAGEHRGREVASTITPMLDELPLRFGAVQWPAPHDIINAEGKPQPAYEGVQYFYVPVVIADNAEPGPITLPVTVYFQACSSFCMAPKEVIVEATLEVLARDADVPASRADDAAFAGFDADAFTAMTADESVESESVSVRLDWNVEDISPTGQAILAVVLDMGEGWHINPDKAQASEGMLPMSVSLGGVEDTLIVGASQYPEAHTIKFNGETVTSYDGQTVVYIPVIVREGVDPGTIDALVSVTYQACTGGEGDAMTGICELETTVELAARLEVVALGEASAMPEQPELFAGFDAAVWPDLAKGIGTAGDAVEEEDAGLILDLYFFTIDLSNGGILAMGGLFLAAIFGGLLLNFTPCVLPVIPIKIMSLSKSGGDRGKTMFLGFVMFAGVVTFWLAIGAAIAFVKNFNAVNQLFQQPFFTLGIGIIIAVMAIGMCGLFTVGLPQWVYRINPKHDSLHGSFGFGVMTAVLATPCTAPFMGAAVAASTKLGSSAITLAVFAAVGVGMGGPYLILAAFPKLVDRVPKSGAGSELLKQVMGLLMLGAAVFFIGNAVVGLTSDGSAAASRVYWWAVGACILVAGVWLVYKINTIGSAGAKRAVFTVIGVLVILLGGATGYAMSRPDYTIQWVYYTPEILQDELDKGNVVVIDFTAEWCLNCKTLEKAVLNPEPVSSELARAGIVPIKVDITSSANVDGNALLQEMERNTIPLLVVMAPDGEIVFKADTYTADQVIRAIREAEAMAGRQAQR